MRNPQIHFVDNVAAKRLLPDADLEQLLESEGLDGVLKTTPKFLAELRRYDPLQLLGLTATHILRWSVAPSLERNPGWRLEAANLELLQAVYLSAGAPEEGLPIIDPSEVEALWTNLRKQHYAIARWDGPAGLRAEEKRLASSIKMHAAFYRNPYGRRFLARMMSSISAEYDRRHGSRLAPFFRWIMSVELEISRRFQGFCDNIRMIAERDIRGALAIAKSLADKNVHAAERLQRAMSTRCSEQELLQTCYNVQEACAEGMFFFTGDQLRALSDDREYDPLPDLARASLGFGELADQALREISAANPVWSKPFVRVESGYYLFSPITLLSFPFHLFLAVTPGNPSDAKKRLEDIRGEFLESTGQTLLEQYLPNARVFKEVYWHDQCGTRCETDLLAILPDRIMVFEAKGAIIPDRVKSGNFVKAKSFLKQNYGVSVGQAARLVAAITALTSLDLYDQNGQHLGTISKSDLRDIISYSLTIDQIGTLANARTDQIAIGIIPEDSFVPPIMISELEEILSRLRTEILCLHYLYRRHQLFGSIDIVGDEMDIFGLYVIYGFAHLPTNEVERLSILGASYEVEKYADNGSVRIPKSSSLANTKYFERILQHVLQRKTAGYLDLAFSILDTPIAYQAKFQEAIRKLRARVKRTSTPEPAIRTADISVVSGTTSLVLMGSVYDDRDREERNATLSHALALTIEKRQCRVGLLIGHQLGFENFPYSVALFLRSEDIPSNYRDHDRID